MDRNDRVEDVGVQKRELERLCFVKFDRNLGSFDGNARLGEFFRVRVDRDDSSSGSGHGDRCVCSTGTEFENSLAVELTEEPTTESAHISGTEFNRIDGPLTTCLPGCGVSAPRHRPQ